MLGVELERRAWNKFICHKLRRVDDFIIKSVYLIGNTGPDGRLCITVAKSHKESPRVANSLRGSGSLFLVKCKLPKNVVNADVYFKHIMGSIKYYFTRLHIYLLINGTGKIISFMGDTSKLPFHCTSRLNKYGDIVLARVKGNAEIEQKHFGKIFCEFYALKHIAELDAYFISEEKVRSQVNEYMQSLKSKEEDDDEIIDISDKIPLSSTLVNISIFNKFSRAISFK